jgi:predicted O-methyltransferase YrrM
MSTIWILIAMSTGGYNTGTITAVEFNSQQACIQAREVMKQNGLTIASTVCVPKDGARK